jgi:hypothetical protein
VEANRLTARGEKSRGICPDDRGTGTGWVETERVTIPSIPFYTAYVQLHRVSGTLQSEPMLNKDASCGI